MKKKIDIGIVVLHYNNYEDTIECVNSMVKNIDTRSFHIVVICNCSPDGSDQKLSDFYNNKEYISVHCSPTNLGFSGGLNEGLKLLKTKFTEIEYIIFSNNDITLLDRYLYMHLVEESKRSDFAVLGPMIINGAGSCTDNPIFFKGYSRRNAEYDLKYFEKRLRAVKCGYEKLFLFNRKWNPCVKRYKRKHYDLRKSGVSTNTYLFRMEDVVCHGSFLVFSRKYQHYFDGLDSRTFLYAEEDILYAHLKDKGLKSVYSPNILIYHRGGSTIDKVFPKNKQKKIFLFTNYIKAINAYIDLLSELGMDF